MFEEKVKCNSCGSTYPPEEPVTYCAECGSTLYLKQDLEGVNRELDRKDLSGRGGDLARYREFLPGEEPLVSLGEGATPVVESGTIANFADNEVYFKLEFTNPTGSFKDRGAAVSVSKAREWGVDGVADDSSGNAGAALAGYAARAGIDCRIYVPASTSGGKVTQVKSYGATLVTVPGPRENATKKVKNEVENENFYYASHNYSPYFLEGMKTLAYEIAEEFEWIPPEHIINPVGGGALIAGVYRGFRDLVNLGWIEEVPRLHCVQTESCDPVVRAFEDGLRDTNPADVLPTVAEGVHIANPNRGRGILEAISKTGGQALRVSENEVEEFHRRSAAEEGIFMEPTSAVPFAGLRKLDERGELEKGERVLIPVTGSGLKDIEAFKDRF
ncbi:threonine synthase [Candidatus Bipolaricaulota bacterium]|nr:threonine synthase [Candidatus Bipolaricaulota bacterium]